MSEYENLGKAIANPLFPIADYKLRRGVHLSIEDVELFDFVKLNYPELAPFYRRYEAELVEGAEGYFYLVSQGAMFGQRQFSKGEMLVALTIAHLYRDPEYRVRGTGEISADHVTARLEALKTMEDIARIMTESYVEEYLLTHAQTCSTTWPQRDYSSLHPVVSNLATSSRWLEHEALVLDRRFEAELESVIQRASAKG